MKEMTTQELLERIRYADAEELNEILAAVTERFREVWPNWDLLVISCEGCTPEDHIKVLEETLRLIRAAALRS